MEFLTWNESLAVGVSTVDAQHRGLVDLVNRLHTAMSEGRGKVMLGETIDELVDYTKIHFSTEETYFDRYGYPEAGSHKSEHEAFIAKVADFKQGFEEDRLMLSLEVMDFLGEWLVDHISVRDKAFGPFLNDHGVA